MIIQVLYTKWSKLQKMTFNHPSKLFLTKDHCIPRTNMSQSSWNNRCVSVGSSGNKQVTGEKTYEWDVDAYRKSPIDKTCLDIFRK